MDGKPYFSRAINYDHKMCIKLTMAEGAVLLYTISK